MLARLIGSLEAWTLALDRTTWKVGSPSYAHNGIAESIMQ